MKLQSIESEHMDQVLKLKEAEKLIQNKDIYTKELCKMVQDIQTEFEKNFSQFSVKMTAFGNQIEHHCLEFGRVANEPEAGAIDKLKSFPRLIKENIHQIYGQCERLVSEDYSDCIFIFLTALLSGSRKC